MVGGRGRRLPALVKPAEGKGTFGARILVDKLFLGPYNKEWISKGSLSCCDLKSKLGEKQWTLAVVTALWQADVAG